MSWKQTVAGCLAAVALMACGSEEENTLRRGRLSLRDGQSITQAPRCSRDMPQCALGLSCMSFMLDGYPHMHCVNPDTVCGGYVTCSGGTECLIAESYPAQVFCSGRCEGPDCDESVSSSP